MNLSVLGLKLMSYRTNSKATLRVTLKDLSPYVPKLLLEQLYTVSCYARNTNSLVFQGQASRKQSDNIQECLEKLRGVLMAACKSVIRGETTPAQVERAKNL